MNLQFINRSLRIQEPIMAPGSTYGGNKLKYDFVQFYRGFIVYGVRRGTTITLKMGMGKITQMGCEPSINTPKLICKALEGLVDEEEVTYLFSHLFTIKGDTPMFFNLKLKAGVLNGTDIREIPFWFRKVMMGIDILHRTINKKRKYKTFPLGRKKRPYLDKPSLQIVFVSGEKLPISDISDHLLLNGIEYYENWGSGSLAKMRLEVMKTEAYNRNLI